MHLINPVNILIKVVFPAPLCPSKTKISLLFSSKHTPFKTNFSPKYFLIFFISIFSFWLFPILISFRSVCSLLISLFILSFDEGIILLSMNLFFILLLFKFMLNLKEIFFILFLFSLILSSQPQNFFVQRKFQGLLKPN